MNQGTPETKSGGTITKDEYIYIIYSIISGQTCFLKCGTPWLSIILQLKEVETDPSINVLCQNLTLYKFIFPKQIKIGSP